MALAPVVAYADELAPDLGDPVTVFRCQGALAG
jgi:hypothetical protein